MKLLSFLLPTTSECRNREAPGDFAAGAGGTVASSRAAISSLVSFPLGLDRPSSEFLLVMFPLVSVSPGLVRVTALTSTRLQARTAPLMATVPGYRGTRSIGGNSPGRDRRGIHISG